MNEFVHCPICSLTNYPYFCHRVLRKKIGDLLSITDGKGHLYHAYIQEIGDKKCLAHIQSCELMPAATYHLHMVVAPTKMNERYEWFLEKAMEIGLQEITPIICEHSERKIVKIERFEKLLLSAMKQSLQYYLPKLNPAISLLEWLDQAPGDAQYIAHCQEYYHINRSGGIFFRKRDPKSIGKRLHSSGAIPAPPTYRNGSCGGLFERYQRF